MTPVNIARFADIVTPALAAGAIEHPGCPGSTGFREDYLVLHCLLRRANPRRVLEIGTHRGVGTKIIANAVPQAEVFSLDLPDAMAHLSQQHPRHDGHTLGDQCDRPFRQICEDSRTFPYGVLAPLDAAYIDGEHAFEHVKAETLGVIVAGATLIVWHDCDMPPVLAGVVAALPEDFDFTRVVDTRIGFAERRPR